MSSEVRFQLAPTGVLRAAINMGNFLLVTGKTASGDPDGVSPDMARELARRLDVECQLVPFATPGELADAAAEDLWDIGNIGARLVSWNSRFRPYSASSRRGIHGK